MKKWTMVLGVATLLATVAPQAEARGRGIFAIGLNFGIPVCPRPVYAPVYYPYYQPYPVYIAPAPVYLAPPPVMVPVAPAAAVSQPAPVVRSQAPAPTNAYSQPPQLTSAHESWQADGHRYLQLLSDPQERVRCDAALELGRQRSQQAIEPLCNVLTSDRSPEVRETAARALGLIGNSRALTALQNAAQVDSDRDVRRSAQFSAEVIRANLRRD